jgi:hypothetical protein
MPGNDAGAATEGAGPMQATTQTTTLATVETVELEQLGFTPDQIARLTALREVYPLIEMVDSAEQLQRLVFLRWLHTTRSQPDDTVAPAA